MNLPIYIGISKELNGIRGVFASRAIEKSAVIEECPVILIPATEVKYLAKTTLHFYEYIWDDDYEALALGYLGCLCNHSSTANVGFILNYKNKSITYKAKEDIDAGNELTINYSQGDALASSIDPGYLDFKR